MASCAACGRVCIISRTRACLRATALRSGNPGDATYEVTFTPADGEPCTGTLGG